MNNLYKAIKAEIIKNKHSNIIWITFLAFALAPIMGAVFVIIISNPDSLAKAGALSKKAEMVNFSADWYSYLSLLTQAVGVGGVLVFGFVASWVFGREYTDGTAKDLLSLPATRSNIINAKFLIYIVWCILLGISNLIIGYLLGSLLQLETADLIQTIDQLKIYFFTTILTVAVGVPIAFFAFWGKGYLAPLGFVALTLVFSQIIAATGFGNYFPWAVPGLYSGSGGAYADQLNYISYFVLMFTSIIGYVATHIYWIYADHSK